MIKNGGMVNIAVIIIMVTLKVTHSVFIGRITSKNVYYYAHSSNRDAKSNKHGFAKYFNENRGRGLIAFLYLNNL